MSFGLQILDAAGNVTFDSTTATGGVCLGYITVPASSSPYVLTYPEFGPGRTGFVMNPAQDGTGSVSQPTYDNSLGYPRFTFATSPFYSYSVLLFLK